MPDRPLEDKISLPAKTQPVRPSLVHYLVGPNVRWTVPGLGWSVWSGLWASFCMCYAGRDRLRLCLRIRRVFFLFRTCAPEIIDLRKQLWS